MSEIVRMKSQMRLLIYRIVCSRLFDMMDDKNKNVVFIMVDIVLGGV